MSMRNTPIESQVLEKLVLEISAKPEEAAIQQLRQHYPGLPMIVCSEDDMFEREPFQTHEGFDLHLMARSMGCAQLTHQLESAAGVIIALHEEE